MASPTATGYRGSRRKRKRTTKASSPPSRSAWTTLEMAFRTNRAWFAATVSATSGYSPRS